MRKVRAKKSLGQHFLRDMNIAHQIVEALSADSGLPVLEIGPGTGVLTRILLEKPFQFKAIELDRDSIAYLKQHFPDRQEDFVEGDFLHIELASLYTQPFAIIGNFPYNISSQIFFKVLDHRDQVLEVVCMLQREVADRIISRPGNRTYGILSVLLQAFYDMEKVTDVPPEVFDPPPKVWSSVIRLKRNTTRQLQCDEKLFRKLVKMSFQMRRKTLRNALKGLNLPVSVTELEMLNKRAEQLSVSDYEALTRLVEKA